ncbi:anti-sigma factor [Pseudarthrobacter sp. NamB4]|uniref:anti-sigma factor n=1 Tax=Pseudarthrobacter sp. NamB4 TaxID=2576837 RepID=UPI0010FDAF68|nr:anti-sigma factor [Pseudarthrobacter sp. NamB4]TLM75875.1 anti-sigma factor [Pseudarthrobacter sp. NamB4]
MRRERQYLERLRDAPIPPASDDLTARLLARTQELAARPAVAPHSPNAPRRAVRFLAITAGSSVAAAAVLAAGAFAAAGDALPGAAAANAAALSQVSSQTPADGRLLSGEQLNRLRSEGWACPELEAMGFRLESARATVRDGGPAVEIRLTDGRHYATVVEQRVPGQGDAAQGSAADVSVGQGAASQDSPLHVWRSSPWSATYRTPGRTFSYESDLPAEQADDAVPILHRLGTLAEEGVAAGVPAAQREAAEESLGTRLQRGVNRIVAFFTA